MSLEAVAKVTKIQPRILERLETGKLDGLPAEVFVRGFVRSVARCVGLDEDEALRRYAACGLATGTADLTPTVRALVEAMVDLAPGSPSAPRATPRRMQAVEIPGMPEILDFGPPGAPDGAVVETMMLPETGTVVLPSHLTAGDGIAASRARESTATMRTTQVIAAIREIDALVAPSALPAGSFDALPVVEPASVEPASVEVFASPVVEAVIAAVAIEPVVISDGGSSKKKRNRRAKGRKRAGDAGMSRQMLATGTPAAASPIVPSSRPSEIAPSEIASSEAASSETAMDAASSVVDAVDAGPAADAAEPVATETWAPKMPPIAATPSVPWRRPAYVASTAAVVPSLVIDDADPDSAERVLEERAETLAPRRSFLPPILLDREDRSGRQGGLTLAVIILLIAATLTLSYLMRRPSASGDGMTRRETPANHVV